MYPLTQSLFGVFISSLIIIGLLIFGKKLPSVEPYSLYIVIFFAICIFLNFNYSFGILEEYENKNR